MSINEAIRSVCPSLSVKIALGVGLFNNALLAMGMQWHLESFYFFHNHICVSLQHPTSPPVLGTERHNKYYEAAWNGQVWAEI